MARILRLSTLFAVLSGHFLLVGCGNKGDLYLPEPPPEPAQIAQPVEQQPRGL